MPASRSTLRRWETVGWESPAGRLVLGAAGANAMFGLAAISVSTNHRASPAHLFAGIAPASVPAYVLDQLLAGVVALGLIAVLYPDLTSEEAGEIMVPRGSPN